MQLAVVCYLFMVKANDWKIFCMNTQCTSVHLAILYEFIAVVVTHGRVETFSHQCTEVKQCCEEPGEYLDL